MRPGNKWDFYNNIKILEIEDISLRILNISLDRDLLSENPENEACIRQAIYAEKLPARMTYLVKTNMDVSPSPVAFAGDKNIVIPCRVRHWLYFPFAAVKSGMRLMRDNTFDIIQVQEPFICGPAGVYLARRLNLPLVAGVFNDDIDNPHWLAESIRNRIANPIGKWVLRHASVIRTDSIQMAHRLKEIGYTRVTYIPFLLTDAKKFYSPTTEATELRLKLLDTNKGPLLLVVARLEWQKNLPMLFKAFASLRCKVPGTILVVAGDGTLREELEAEAQVLAPGSILFLGRVPYDQLPALFQAADLSVLPSHHETSARVLSLSLLAGTPVLSTDTTGAREVIEDRVTGRIVPVGDLDVFTAALVELCMDVEARREMGLRAKEQMIKKVSIENIVSALREMYLKILEKGS